MKIFRIFLFLLLIPMVSATPAHKFYVSITKIEYVKEKSSLQIITKIFIDDIEDALQQRFDPSISLDTKKETEAADEDLKKYILQKINIKVNGKPVQLNYIGKEYDTDMVVAYIEVKNVKDIKTIEIENKVLMDLFPEQQNIIHLKTPKNRRSLILDKDEPKGKLDFN
ncbi:hypothetical protein Aeqsu_0482 [Aequorivita sublithincola DSM 14238]|uniref:Peptidase E n=1 Tax=Aequorivita sublithincola (strain DSM 14238 / LMG 21431 / ACAM 643 / 9-3) TaxID=746697 RepID=I3YSM6_AEQSU|nr:DUF6702 family protein [Aequorivita sublithincola]AFL79994.1 hypothetical protein Aeqsu_0482 [Aequorivita sublithincola DSM 14238]